MLCRSRCGAPERGPHTFRRTLGARPGGRESRVAKPHGAPDRHAKVVELGVHEADKAVTCADLVAGGSVGSRSLIPMPSMSPTQTSHTIIYQEKLRKKTKNNIGVLMCKIDFFKKLKTFFRMLLVRHEIYHTAKRKCQQWQRRLFLCLTILF